MKSIFFGSYLKNKFLAEKIHKWQEQNKLPRILFETLNQAFLVIPQPSIFMTKTGGVFI
jgi:hypothetical protein